MKKFSLMIIGSLLFFWSSAQIFPNGNCNESNLIINTIFYPNTSVTYTNNNILQESLYLCGPNTNVYDIINTLNRCRTVFVNSNCLYYTDNPGCGYANFILAKNNSTVVIMSNANPGCMRLWYEPNATIINQTSGLGMQTYSCSSIIFPTVNCTPNGLKENNSNTSAFEIFPNPANDKLNIEFTVNDLEKEFIKAEIINSVGQVIKEIDFYYTNKKATININELQSGFYLLRLLDSARSDKSIIATKRFVIAR